ncbi:MAG: DUF1015 domain-containing protein [Candidatus Omnitrophica bacterium]|nr:DUF1015 domain-containing protein [Candidatus Omnitrophota bacterium]
MAKIKSFKGILYNTELIEDIAAVSAPPYDVISDHMREELYKTHPNNVVRIILGKEFDGDTPRNNKYTRAADHLTEWLRDGILKQDKRSSIYIYEQQYLYRGKLNKRIGFISVMKIEDPSSSLVLPHEYTFSKPKADRLNLIRKTKANTSPIFCIYQDDHNKVTGIIKGYARKASPIVDIHFEGVRHKLWRLSDPRGIEMIQRCMDSKQVFIADGHHRYEVALAYRDEMRRRLGRIKARLYDNVMAFFSNLTDENLVIFSTYRIVRDMGNMDFSEIEKKLSPYFYISTVKDKNELFKRLEQKKKAYAFGMYFKNKRLYLLTLKDESVLDEVIKVDKSREWKRLNVTVLHFLIFDHILNIERNLSNDKNIIYTREEDYAIKLVESGECEAAFFQLPTKVIEVRNIARSGDRMPHKSTYFYPKLLTGLVMNKF